MLRLIPWLSQVVDVPKDIESVRQGFLATYSASAVVVSKKVASFCDPAKIHLKASLFVATEATLLTLIKTEANPRNRTSMGLLIACMYGASYAAMMLSLGAVIASIGLIDRLGILPYTYNQSRHSLELLTAPENDFWLESQPPSKALGQFQPPRDLRLAKICGYPTVDLS